MNSTILQLCFAIGFFCSGSGSAQAIFTESQPRPLYESSVYNQSRYDVLLADFDNDGKKDILYTTDLGVRFLFNEGNGHFSETWGPNGNFQCHSKVADVDKDGDLDVFLLTKINSSSPPTLSLVFNKGGRTFSITSNLATAFADYAVGDLDKDGYPDLVLGINGQNRLLRNTGKGNFKDVTQGRLPYVSDATYCVRLADVNGDGHLDIMSNDSQGMRLAINDGKGSFTTAATTGITPFLCRFMELADMDGDGDLDLALGWSGSGLQLWLNNGKGVFSKTVAPYGLSHIAEFTFGDIDRDGNQDIVIGQYDGGSGYGPRQNALLVNDGKGVYTDETARRFPALQDATTAVALGDLDNDGDQDILFASLANYRSIGTSREKNPTYTNDGKGKFSLAMPKLGGSQPLPMGANETNKLLLADLNGDSYLDILEGNDWQQSNRFLQGDGKGSFVDASTGFLPADSDDTVDMALVDLNGDGLKDLFMANWGQNRLYLGIATGGFQDLTATALPKTSTNSISVAVGDLDGDKDLDLIIANMGQDNLLLNDGKGVFSDNTWKGLPPNTNRSDQVGLVDPDGDGDLDLLTCDKTTRCIYFSKNNGKANFGTRSKVGNYFYHTFVLGDFTGDKCTDLVTANYKSAGPGFSLITWSKVAGNWLVSQGSPGGRDGTPTSMVAADVDDDGDLDILVSRCFSPTYGDGENLLLLNNGSGVFTLIKLSERETNTRNLAVGDLDGDGDLDTIIGNRAHTGKGIQNRIHYNLLRQLDIPGYLRLGRTCVVDVWSFNPKVTQPLNTLLFISTQEQKLQLPPHGIFWLNFSGLIGFPTLLASPVAKYRLPIPNNPALNGLQLSFQAVVEGRDRNSIPNLKFTNVVKRKIEQ